jgi:hypothetical protein
MQWPGTPKIPTGPAITFGPVQARSGANSRAQHQAFLNEVEGDCSLHADLMDWFYTLPLWLDLPDLRVVRHAGMPVHGDAAPLADRRQLPAPAALVADRSGHPVFQAAKG